MWRIGLGAVGLVFAAVGIVLLANTTGASPQGLVYRVNLVTFADGAAPNTFWDTSLVDVPSLSLTAVHCHGSVTYELQAGATGPLHGNACLAAIGAFEGGRSSWGVYRILPGNRAVYRISQNDGPWRYCIAHVSTVSASPSGVPALTPPC